MSSKESVSPHDVIVCACGTQEYTAGDAVDAAIFRGELEEKWQAFLRHVAAEERADELELELDESAISAAAEEFRYRHDLITAEETERWLSDRGLTFEEFSDYFARQYCVRAVNEGLSPERIGYTSAAPELRDLFVAELILSGALEEITTKLMWRLAARCAGNEPTSEAIAAEKRKFLNRIAIEPALLTSWLDEMGRDSQWLDEMLAVEAAYKAHCDALLVPEARQRELMALRLPLTRFEIELIELESHDAAKEALFCVREDGMSMEEVATDGRYPYRRVDSLLEDLPTTAQQKYLSVSQGDVLEAMPRGDGFELCRVVRKIEPRLEDPTVKLRIDQRLLNQYFSDLTTKYTHPRLSIPVSME
ncbi:MAG: hypothetical protein WA269_03950 [Candidatus Udaeobacter sp.]